MSNTKKYYRTIVKVEVLSEEPIGDMDLSDIAHQGEYGDLSIHVDHGDPEEVDGKTMANLLIAQGSDPEFLGLDNEGNDIYDSEYQEEQEEE